MNVKEVFITTSLAILAWSAMGASDNAICVHAQEHAKIPLVIGAIGSPAAAEDVQGLALSLARDLSWSGQCKISLVALEKEPTKNVLAHYAQHGRHLALFVEESKDGLAVLWRLYDTVQPTMIKGKSIAKRGCGVHMLAHEIADSLWPILTGQEGFFSTKIAYCRQVVRLGKKRPLKYLCVADYDGSNEIVMVPTVVIAPRWGICNLLFYSECTNTNVRLSYIDHHGRRHVVSDFDGLNMQVSSSQDGTKYVYCASRGNGSSQLYYCAPGVFKRLTHNKGTNVSPTMAADGLLVYFCSDFKSGIPAIYSCNTQTGALREIVSHGLCPSYSSKTHAIAYLRKVKGTMQIFVRHVDSKVDEQMTFDAGNKDECSWSACGNYLVYSVGNASESRIAALNVTSGQRTWITPAGAVCTYPSWSAPQAARTDPLRAFTELVL